MILTHAIYSCLTNGLRKGHSIICGRNKKLHMYEMLFKISRNINNVPQIKLSFPLPKNYWKIFPLPRNDRMIFNPILVMIKWSLPYLEMIKWSFPFLDLKFKWHGIVFSMRIKEVNTREFCTYFLLCAFALLTLVFSQGDREWSPWILKKCMSWAGCETLHLFCIRMHCFHCSLVHNLYFRLNSSINNCFQYLTFQYLDHLEHIRQIVSKIM